MVILPHQVLEVAIVSKQVALVRVDKAVAYLDIDDTDLVEGGLRPASVTCYTVTRTVTLAEVTPFMGLTAAERQKLSRDRRRRRVTPVTVEDDTGLVEAGYGPQA